MNLPHPEPGSAAARLPAQPAVETLAGVLERIIFFNEENHYTIGELCPDPPSRDAPLPAPVIITGVLPGVRCGETLELAGVWAFHREHGAQFKVRSFKARLPSSVHGIRKYLGSGLVPGIGKTYARKIVDKFGEKTLEVISTQSARLREVPGIGAKRAVEIKKAWEDQSATRDVMVFLHAHGVSTSQCLRIIRQYGPFAKMLLENEPYKIAREIDGIGFRTADRIARNLGLPTEGAARIEAGIMHAHKELEEDGHTAVMPGALLARAMEVLEVASEKVASVLDLLVGKGRLEAGPDGSLQSPRQARAEEQIAAAVERLLAAPSAFPPIQVERAIAWAQDRAGFAFAPAQVDAIRSALANKFTILTGGPGTGKTTILSALTAILVAKKVRIVLAAPTGRAAQRMAETTRLQASTIHRLLKYEPEAHRFHHNEENPISAGILVVDEASMLDNRLAGALLCAVPANAHVLLVGDTHQLPSVGPGNVLQDLATCGRIPVTTLTAIHRQGARSQIVATAHNILQGNPVLPATNTAYDPGAEIQFLPVPDAGGCLETVVRLCGDLLPANHKLDPFRDIEVLAPMHKGIAGVQSINAALQLALGKSHAATAGGPDRASRAGAAGVPAHSRLEPGDKVIQTRNNYDKGVFNGDLGRVRAIHPETGVLSAEFDAATADYDRAEQDELQLAYAITIHKSQGSEFDTVVIPLVKAHFLMLQRNLIYTAITRGRKRVILVGDPAAYTLAVRNAESLRRHTLLPFRLGKILGKC
ncbi:MAG: ATP-dependent RecD-like DNA helicase [Puniceicoccales bacterium]|nr:ATP-dependent RecD-like DNA helicase [Puniceicoccales bacterium]